MNILAGLLGLTFAAGKLREQGHSEEYVQEWLEAKRTALLNLPEFRDVEFQEEPIAKNGAFIIRTGSADVPAEDTLTS